MINDAIDSISLLSKRIFSSPMPKIKELKFSFAGENSAPGGDRVEVDADYFGISFNEMQLANGREWWTTYDPLVYIQVGFTLGSERITIPRLIGPSAIRGDLATNKLALPHGFSVKDVEILAPHPYKGGNIDIKVILLKVRHTDYSTRFLTFLENVSKVAVSLPFAGSATELARSMIEAVGSLLEPGDTVPVLGHQVSLNPPLQGLRCHSMALISEGATDAVWSIEGERLRATSERAAACADFVLYSVWKRKIPAFGGLRSYEERIEADALRPDPESWARAKATLLTYYQELLSSPLIYSRDADTIFERMRERMLELRVRSQKAVLLSLGVSESEDASRSRLDEVTRSIIALG